MSIKTCCSSHKFASQKSSSISSRIEHMSQVFCDRLPPPPSLLRAARMIQIAPNIQDPDLG